MAENITRFYKELPPPRGDASVQQLHPKPSEGDGVLVREDAEAIIRTDRKIPAVHILLRGVIQGPTPDGSPLIGDVGHHLEFRPPDMDRFSLPVEATAEEAINPAIAVNQVEKVLGQTGLTILLERGYVQRHIEG